jgi:hypothetical protein
MAATSGRRGHPPFRQVFDQAICEPFRQGMQITPEERLTKS